MYKKLLVFILAGCLAFCLFGCKKQEIQTDESADKITEVEEKNEEKSPEPTPGEQEVKEPETVVSPPEDSKAVSEEPKHSTESIKTEYGEEYGEFLLKCYDILLNGSSSDAVGESRETEEFAMLLSYPAAYDIYSLEFAKKDINGDGIYELIIGSSDENYAFAKNSINAIYTLSDSKVKYVASYSYVNNASLRSDGSIYQSGRASAASSGFGVYDFNGAELVCREFYFFEASDANTFSFYKNTTGEFDKENSKKFDITMEEYKNIKDNLSADCPFIEMTPFSVFMEV